jgi:2-keto-4-pentenoate hydratase/2-oxohepta-3-ene-1,7-dioic acid hydratase in catechol pathway
MGPIAGLTVGQDISNRHLQCAAGGQFSLGKSRQGYGPMRMWVVTPDELADRDDLVIGCAADGEKTQDPTPATSSSVSPFSASLVAEVSGVLPLLPGDLGFTGSLRGRHNPASHPRFLEPGGQVLESWIEGIGSIRNRCR